MEFPFKYNFMLVTICLFFQLNPASLVLTYWREVQPGAILDSSVLIRLFLKKACF